MPGDLDVALRKLRNSAAQLNAVSDSATKIVSQIEEFLNDDCGVGVEASIVFDSGDVTDDRTGQSFGEYSYRLAYTRVAGRFRIAVVLWNDVTDEPPTAKSWAECGRDTKLRSFPFLPSLLEKIAESVDAKVNETHAVMKMIQPALASFQGKK